MTDLAPIRSPRPRSMSRLQALALAVILILGGVASRGPTARLMAVRRLLPPPRIRSS